MDHIKYYTVLEDLYSAESRYGTKRTRFNIHGVNNIVYTSNEDLVKGIHEYIRTTLMDNLSCSYSRSYNQARNYFINNRTKRLHARENDMLLLVPVSLAQEAIIAYNSGKPLPDGFTKELVKATPYCVEDKGRFTEPDVLVCLTHSFITDVSGQYYTFVEQERMDDGLSYTYYMVLLPLPPAGLGLTTDNNTGTRELIDARYIRHEPHHRINQAFKDI